MNDLRRVVLFIYPLDPYDHTPSSHLANLRWVVRTLFRINARQDITLGWGYSVLATAKFRGLARG